MFEDCGGKSTIPNIQRHNVLTSASHRHCSDVIDSLSELCVVHCDVTGVQCAVLVVKFPASADPEPASSRKKRK